MVLPSELRIVARPSLQAVFDERGAGLGPVLFRVGVVEGRPAWAVMLNEATEETTDDEPRIFAGSLQTCADLDEFVDLVLEHTPEGMIARGSYASDLEPVLQRLIPCENGLPEAAYDVLKQEMFVRLYEQEWKQNPVMIHADASRNPYRRGVGLGWVVTGGGLRPRYRCRFIGTTNSILAGEIMAAMRGLNDMKDVPQLGPIVVKTDSIDAVQRLRGQWAGEQPGGLGACMGEYLKLYDRVRHLNVRFDWVKGHNGDPYNEAADRLAVGVRRNHQLGAPHMDAVIVQRVAELLSD